jgi:hypothetical protein
MDDGSRLRIKGGDTVGPSHDAWIEGTEPCIAVVSSALPITPSRRKRTPRMAIAVPPRKGNHQRYRPAGEEGEELDVLELGCRAGRAAMRGRAAVCALWKDRASLIGSNIRLTS